MKDNFNPRSPCGERPAPQSTDDMDEIFQSTLPVRGATLAHLIPLAMPRISIHAPRAGSDPYNAVHIQSLMPISIHAPRAGSDRDYKSGDNTKRISIHAPRAGSDGGYIPQRRQFFLFQSTLPVRGATVKTRIIIRIFK